MSNLKLRKRLLREADLTLDKCVQISRSAELFKERTKTIGGAEQVHRVNLKGPWRQNKDRSTKNANFPYWYYRKQHAKQKEK